MDAGVREKHLHRVEVLEQVKGLLLLPKLEVASTKQVADFYEVEVDAINSINRRHREELENDGMTIIKRGNIEDFLNGQSDHIEITPYVATMMDEQGVKYSFNNRGSYVFPRRAILRFGMLLKGSEIEGKAPFTKRSAYTNLYKTISSTTIYKLKDNRLEIAISVKCFTVFIEE
ncbi:TPA: hypothetical protein QCX24_005904 [Bacillus toyonensis]|nr:hypothetical protein [Bacillus toyonensis]